MNSPIHSNALAHRLALLALTLLGFTGSLMPTSATAALAQGGYTTDTDTFDLLGTFGSDSYYLEDYRGSYTGGLSGPAHDLNYIVVHADGSFESFAQEVCTGCTVGGRTGNFTASYVIIGTGWDLENFTSVYTGYLWITSASGGLAGLHGSMIFHYDGITGVSNYTLNYRFAR